MGTRRLLSNLICRILNKQSHSLGISRPIKLTARSVQTTSLSRNEFQDSRLPVSIEDIENVGDCPRDVTLNPFSRDVQSYHEYLEELHPPLKKSFNLAAFVNSSKCLQEFIKLGVSLYDIENVNYKEAKRLIYLDFERDCAPYVKFLVDAGLKAKNLGRFISEYPSIFQVPLEDLQVRIEYLKSKDFSQDQISKALNRSSQILVHNVKTLDFKLGQLQIEFILPAPILRTMVSKYPPIVSIPHSQYKLTHFCLTEEFGFETDQMHKIMDAQPQIMDILRPVLIRRLDLIHNHIGLSHQQIAEFPKLITGPKMDIWQRFEYLKKLRRNQFEPKLPLYVPPSALYNGQDWEFCKNYAKTSYKDYKLFIKSM